MALCYDGENLIKTGDTALTNTPDFPDFPDFQHPHTTGPCFDYIDTDLELTCKDLYENLYQHEIYGFIRKSEVKFFKNYNFKIS